MKHAKSCASCARGIEMRINKDILCKIKGVVSQDFICSKYIRKVGLWSPSERIPKCIECEFFIVSDSKEACDSGYGYCHLFTVRTYNGELKSACSKFSKKTVRIIS